MCRKINILGWIIFFARVIEYPIKDIQESLPYKITCTKKHGRYNRVTALHFDVYDLNFKEEKAELADATAQSIAQSEMVASLTKEERDCYERLFKEGKVDSPTSLKFVKKYGVGHCIANLKFALKQPNIHNLGGYVVTCIEQNKAGYGVRLVKQPQQQSMPVADIAAQAATQAKKPIPSFAQSWLDKFNRGGSSEKATSQDGAGEQSEG